MDLRCKGSLSLLFLKTCASPSDALLRGFANSLAASLDYAISKQPLWLTEMFGCDQQGISLGRGLITSSSHLTVGHGGIRVPHTFMSITPELVDYLMREALAEANLAAKSNEVPVGAVIAHCEKIIGRGHNTTESDSSVVSHAEIHAINMASRSLSNWRLSECVLCVTLEPCTMCLGAIRLARIPTLIFGAGDSKQGAVGSLYDLSQDARVGGQLRVIQGVAMAECKGVLEAFFKNKRGLR